MPKRNSTRSDTSKSSSSRQSIGFQYANQSPTTSKTSLSSSGLTRVMSTIYETFSGSKQMTGLDGEEMDPGLRTPPDTSSGFSLTLGSPAGLAKKRRPSIRGSKGSGVMKSRRSEMERVVATTKKATLAILAKTELEGTRFGYMANQWTAPELYSTSVEYPNVTTMVRVVAGDTYDRALEMQDAGSTTDHMPVCVLNFANAFNPGGGWLGGSQAQEEQLCYRSTLIDTLHTRFYPMEDLECLYSPNVIVFRKSVDSKYSFMAGGGELHLNPTVSVISMAARDKPGLVNADGLTYKDAAQKCLMIAKMQLILRTAAHNNHRRLVLGAIGCGAFRHPAQVVAECWYEVLMKEEFKGWFEKIYFVIRDSPAENKLGTFVETLDGLNIG